MVCFKAGREKLSSQQLVEKELHSMCIRGKFKGMGRKVENLERKEKWNSNGKWGADEGLRKKGEEKGRSR